ncbi:MAG: hypothetical protein WBF81_03955 [Thermoplasmata archaeon]
MSPRKSSTSSARPATLRPRYLGIEAAGEHFPAPPPRWWEATLRRCLDGSPAAGRFRLVRADGYRAIVEVDQFRAPGARVAWTTVLDGPTPSVRLTTRRTWGTLRGAKVWIRNGSRPRLR